MSSNCLISECKNKNTGGRGLCRKHYDNPETRTLFKSRRDGFKVDFKYAPNREGLCWNKECSRPINPTVTTYAVCGKCYSLVKNRGQLSQLVEIGIEGRLFALQVTSADGNECYSWRGSTDLEGYARLSWKGLWNVKAHRLSLSAKIGRELLPDEHACHRCDNPVCTNPEHLFVGSAKDNYEDMISKGRGRWQKESVN